jgi:hypothetical protein
MIDKKTMMACITILDIFENEGRHSINLDKVSVALQNTGLSFTDDDVATAALKMKRAGYLELVIYDTNPPYWKLSDSIENIKLGLIPLSEEFQDAKETLTADLEKIKAEFRRYFIQAQIFTPMMLLVWYYVGWSEFVVGITSFAFFTFIVTSVRYVYKFKARMDGVGRYKNVLMKYGITHEKALAYVRDNRLLL